MESSGLVEVRQRHAPGGREVRMEVQGTAQAQRIQDVVQDVHPVNGGDP